MMMLIPEAWEKDPEVDDTRKAFYEYHGALIEPWDGPASVAFSDGTLIGATLDRNGLRPSRYCLTDDNILIMASEAGVLDVPPEKVVRKGRLQPGRMFVASLEEGRIIPDEEIKARICSEKPYRQWLDAGKIPLAELEPPRQILQPPARRVLTRQKVFGYSLEDLRILMAPMVKNAQEPIGSMGNDTPLAVLSDKSRSLFDYFHQLFAQVTNPPIDPIREELVMSLSSFVGGEGNILEDGPEHAEVIELPQPVLTNEDLERLRWVDRKHFQAKTLSICFKAEPGRMQRALDRLRREAEEYVLDGYQVIILTDRPVDSAHTAIPSLLAVSAVHHHLIRKGLRSRCGLVIETGEAREVHHFACLLGFGASAVNPYVAFETIEDMRLRRLLPKTLGEDEAREHYIKAVGKGLLKTMSKMGISTISSYIGAQIFEAVGLADEVIEEYFPGTVSRIGGIDIATLERETLVRHRAAYVDVEDQTDLELGGLYQWRLRGERHLHNPESIHRLQHAARQNDYELYREYARTIDDAQEAPITLRHLLEFTNHTPIPIEEVEPVEAITKRFATGAMSFGSISWEAHTTLAIAMNRLGGKSNTGEGGEDPIRYQPLPNGDSMRSAIKQVASARFGVTSNYLVNADELQIKMAQGAKPGEGGQLPGHKVDKTIARVRYSTPYVGLISPPPHHDIYSIEDLAQLIYDLKNANPRARINVKLVAEVGVGTIAAGVAKAHADVILISGQGGGTGGVAAVLHQARRSPLGAGPGRGSPGPHAEQPPGPGGAPDRRPPPDRPGRGRGRSPRRRGVGHRHRRPRRHGMHPHEEVPPQHLPGGGGHPGRGASEALQRRGGPRGELLPLRRPGPARAHGPPGVPHRGRDGGPGGQAGPRPGREAQQGPPAGPGTAAALHATPTIGAGRSAAFPRTTVWTGRWTTSSCGWRRPPWRRESRSGRASRSGTPTAPWARSSDRRSPAAPARRGFRRTRSASRPRARRASPSWPSPRRASPSSSRARPTTTSARASPAAPPSSTRPGALGSTPTRT